MHRSSSQRIAMKRRVKPRFASKEMMMLAALLFSAAAWVRPDVNGHCAENHPVSGATGITSFVCHGGYCTVNSLDDDGHFIHTFSSEPEIAGIAPNGPSASILREGDLL